MLESQKGRLRFNHPFLLSALSASKSGDPTLPCGYRKIIYNYFSCDFLSFFFNLFYFFLAVSVLVWLPTFLSNYKNCCPYKSPEHVSGGPIRELQCVWPEWQHPEGMYFWIKALLSSQPVREENRHSGFQWKVGNWGGLDVSFPKWRFPNQLPFHSTLHVFFHCLSQSFPPFPSPSSTCMQQLYALNKSIPPCWAVSKWNWPTEQSV